MCCLPFVAAIVPPTSNPFPLSLIIAKPNPTTDRQTEPICFPFLSLPFHSLCFSRFRFCFCFPFYFIFFLLCFVFVTYFSFTWFLSALYFNKIIIFKLRRCDHIQGVDVRDSDSCFCFFFFFFFWMCDDSLLHWQRHLRKWSYFFLFFENNKFKMKAYKFYFK